MRRALQSVLVCGQVAKIVACRCVAVAMTLPWLHPHPHPHPHLHLLVLVLLILRGGDQGGAGWRGFDDAIFLWPPRTPGATT